MGSSFTRGKLPDDCLSTDRIGTRRLKTDSLPTAFCEGRQWRISRGFTALAGAEVVIRFTCAVDFVLTRQRVSVDDGAIEFRAYRDGIEGGAWSSVPILSNNHPAAVALQATVDSGGTFDPDGNDYAEIIRVRGSNSTAQKVTISGNSADVRGLEAGTYYLVFDNIASSGDTQFIYDLVWEEEWP